MREVGVQFLCSRGYAQLAQLWFRGRTGMQCFKDAIHDVVTADVRSAILALIQQEREGEAVDHTLLKDVVEVIDAPPVQSSTF